MTRPTPGQPEQRSRPTLGDLEERAAPTAAPTIDGRRLRGVVPYAVESRDLGGWREVMEPGSLRNATLSDLVATVDHGGVPIGRHPGTLAVEHKDDGLHWSVDLPESRSDVREAVERGDLCAGSWRMIVGRDRWVGNVRHVEEVRELRDVAIVSQPAYAASVVEHRSAPPAGPTPGPSPRRGGLRVEARDARPSGRGGAEARIMDAIASVAPGELRDLTHATASPVEPDDLRTVLIDRFREASVVAASGVPIVVTDKLNVSWPTLTSDVASAFYDELDPITESDPGLGEFEVPVKALKTLVRASSEAVEDSDPDLLKLLQDHLLTTMVLKADRELVAGNDAKGFKGILNLVGTQTLAVDGPLSWDAVIKAAGRLSELNVPGPYAVLVGPRPLVGLDLTKELATGSNAYVGRPAGIPPVFQTGWLPVTGTTPDFETTAVVYAPASSMIVLRRDVTVEVDRSAEFASDAVLVRGRYRLGFGTPHPQSVVLLTGVDAPVIE